MDISDTYLTISAAADGLYKDKGSKFLAYAYPVKTEADVKQHIALLKKEHVSARHFCYAYLLGAEKQQYRANDDGEPSGTAGKPILGQLQSKNLTNIVDHRGAILRRYFAGHRWFVMTCLQRSGCRCNCARNDSRRNYYYLLRSEIPRLPANECSVMKLCKDFDLKIIQQDLQSACTIIIEI